MKSPVVYGNPVPFGAVDWNYAAGAPVRKGKSVEDLGDAGWARERERVAHLQHLQHLQQLQLQQRQVGYPGYGVIALGQPQGPVKVASPVDSGLLAPGCPVPVHGGVMVPAGGPVHVPTQWPVQWGDQAQIRPGNVWHQTSWEHSDQSNGAFKNKRPQGQDVYFHPGSQDGHLDVRISEWKGKNCFYQGPEDCNKQDYRGAPQGKDSYDFKTPEGYDKLDEDRRRRDREDEHTSEGHDRRRRRDSNEYDQKNKYRDYYDRKNDEYYDEREHQYNDIKSHRKYDHREHDSYNSEYEDHYDQKDTYVRRNNYRDSDQYDYDRDYYDSKESNRSREKDYYQCREEGRHYDERKRRDPYYDRYADDRYDPKDKDVCYRRGEEGYISRERRHDSERDEHRGSKERILCNKFKDRGDDRRDEYYDHRRRDNYRTREHYERRPMDPYRDEDEDRYVSREWERSLRKPRDRYRDLRSVSIDSQYEEYPKKDRKTHCEEWVEQQNKKFVLGEMHSFEDPGVYRHSDEQENGYELNAGSVGAKRGNKPVYVGSLDRNSFYRKTAPSSLRKSQFATTRRQNKGKHKDIIM